MKRSAIPASPAMLRTARRRAKPRALSLSAILRAAYRAHSREKLTRLAVKQCLG